MWLSKVRILPHSVRCAQTWFGWSHGDHLGAQNKITLQECVNGISKHDAIFLVVACPLTYSQSWVNRSTGSWPPQPAGRARLGQKPVLRRYPAYSPCDSRRLNAPHSVLSSSKSIEYRGSMHECVYFRPSSSIQHADAPSNTRYSV